MPKRGYLETLKHVVRAGGPCRPENIPLPLEDRKSGTTIVDIEKKYAATILIEIVHMTTLQNCAFLAPLGPGNHGGFHRGTRWKHKTYGSSPWSSNPPKTHVIGTFRELKQVAI